MKPRLLNPFTNKIDLYQLFPFEYDERSPELRKERKARREARKVQRQTQKSQK
jgi:hypothetical protein